MIRSAGCQDKINLYSLGGYPPISEDLSSEVSLSPLNERT